MSVGETVTGFSSGSVTDFAGGEWGHSDFCFECGVTWVEKKRSCVGWDRGVEAGWCQGDWFDSGCFVTGVCACTYVPMPQKAFRGQFSPSLV